MVGDDGIEPPQADSKSAALPLCKSPVTKNGACGEVWTHDIKFGKLVLYQLSYTRKKWRRRRVLPPQWLLDHGSLANCCRNLTIYVTSVKSFDKLRFLQETILSVFGSIVMWSCIKMAVDVRTARTFVFQRTQFSRLMQPAYICLSTV